MLCDGLVVRPSQPSERGALPSEGNQGDEWDAYVTLDTYDRDERGINPQGREARGDGVLVVVVRFTPHQGGRESRPQGDMLRATYRPLCCAQNYVALRADVDAVAGDRGLRAQHNLGPVDGSRATRAAWLARHRPGLAIRRPNAIEHASLEFRPGLDRHVRRVERLTVGPQRDSRDVKPAENMLC